MEKDVFPFVIIGHVDHGKSTLIGRILLDTGCLPQSIANELADAGADGQLQLAHISDHFREERDRGITIDTSQRFFETSGRRYVIIDAPGHKEFLKNMLSGASMAEGAVLIVDAAEGIMDQTYRHAYLVSLIGIRQVIVAVNKMDAVGWSQERFNQISAQLDELFKRLNIRHETLIPLSALQGDNVVSRSPHMNWYQGPSLLEALERLTARGISGMGLRFAVQDRYDFPANGPYIVGRVEAGILKEGQEVVCLPEGRKDRITSIEKFGVGQTGSAGPEECVAIKTEAMNKLRRGEVLTGKADGMTVSDRVKCRVFWLSPHAGRVNAPLSFRCATQTIPCAMESIGNIFDPGSLEPLRETADGIHESHVADIVLKLETNAAFDHFGEVPATGRLVLEKGDETVAAGIII